MKVFTVLMWHHLLVRKRRFIMTTVEFILPTVLYILIFCLRENLSGIKLHEKQNIHYTEPMSIKDTKPLSVILYTPSTQLTDVLMDAVGQKLGLPRLNSFPGANSKGYYTLANDSAEALSQFVPFMSDDDAVVIFSNMDAAQFPPKLNYTIRMKVNFMTHIYQSMDDQIGPHERFSTIYEPFMKLQWAIDQTYLQMRTDSVVDREIYLQEFPFSDNSVYPSAEIVALLVDSAGVYGLMMPYIFLLLRLMTYRQTGIEDLIRMVGVTPNMLKLSHFVNMLPVCLIFTFAGVLFTKISSTALIPFTNFMFLLVILVLYFISIITLAFLVSHVSDSSQYATPIAITSYIIFMLVRNLIEHFVDKIPVFLIPITGLWPHVPTCFFFKNLGSREMIGEGITLSNMFRNDRREMSPFVCYVMLILQTCLFALLSWYLSYVRPGKYGVGRPYNFLFQRSFWSKKVDPNTELAQAEEEAEPMARDPLYFEPSTNTEVGIKIVDVSKIYGKNKALTNVTFDVYKGEIAVLLGHNGAGKTTLMSIITALERPTSGSVFVNGWCLASHERSVRRELGFCPQHNLTVPSLSVLEQVMFFALLKGESYQQAKESSTKLLHQLGLEGKLHSLVDQLSGGMKRRVQLGCALAGGSSVLILDEPTSGLDVETRRELWDLLLSLRGERTVLISTHFMEEADALGDRVAALHGGLMRCHATPMYLKKSIGTGYRLTLTTIGLPKEELITSLITSQVPEAVLKEKTYNSLVYTLPSHSNRNFPQLFSNLENERSELGIDNIGVGVSTLEEVFLKLCSNVDTNLALDTVDAAAPEPTYERRNGCGYYLEVLAMLMMRQLKYLAHNKFTFLILQVFIPVAAMILFLIMTLEKAELENKNFRRSMDLDLYREREGKRVIYNGVNLDLRKMMPKYEGVEFVHTDKDIASAVLDDALKSSSEYNKYIAGIQLNDTHATVWYTTSMRHAAPVALNLLSNLLAAESFRRAGDKSDAGIAVYNEPLEEPTANKTPKQEQPLSVDSICFWVLLLMMLILGTLTSAPALASQERRLGTRHIHMMSGCPPSLHWLATLLAHTAVYTLVLIVPACLVTLMDDKHTISAPGFIWCMFIIMLVGTMSFLALSYLITFITTQGVGLILFLILFLLGILPGVIISSMRVMGLELSSFLRVTEICLEYVSPPYAATAAMVRAGSVAYDNRFCNLNRKYCPALALQGPKYAMCCDMGDDPYCYFCFGDLKPLKYIIVMVCLCIFYMALVILEQYGVFSSMFGRLLSRLYSPAARVYNDPVVQAENTYVSKAISLPKKQIPDAMLVSDLHKSYFRLLGKPVPAVKGVSFSVKKGECFGLLGVNGAGKSSTFKMITAETPATRGRCFANSHFLQWPKEPYLHSLGYCPQFFGLDEFLSGRENLRLLLTLRGLRPNDVNTEVDSWIAVAGLERYADMNVSMYSGGCARRLATIGALCGGAALTLLDEPTAGVDVAARRRVWMAVKRGLSTRRSIVLTSHSMDEMEALCDRIAIMSVGELAALGSAPALRQAYAAGHALAIKIAHNAHDETDGAQRGIEELKATLHTKLAGRLTDEHKTMLHYHIEQAMRYSELFAALEELRQLFPHLIEDYSVTETTLEEVFLSFAHPPNQAGNAAV